MFIPRSILLFIPVLLFMLGCGGGNGGDESIIIPDSVKAGPSEKLLDVSDKVIEDLVRDVSSPVEMAALIQKAGVPFSKDYLSDPDYIDNYNTSFKKALNLGVLGADLGYMNIYDKTSMIFDHITAIKKVSDDLKIGQFFDFSTLKRLASNNENLDSLMYISTSSFNKMDRYLRENNRSSASSLIVAGVWIEGLYLATQVAKKTDNVVISERIAEQKISLVDLIIVLRVYENIDGFKELIDDFELIKEAFDPIVITVEKGDSRMEERDGRLIIIDNDKQHVNIPEGQMEKIIEITEQVRNKIIGK